jgi:hypothetical protein
MANEWSPSQFGRRQYTIEGDDLDKASKIRVVVYIDNQKIVDVQAREPGILAVVSKPDEQGMDVEIVEPGGARFVDYKLPSGEQVTPSPEAWQLDALGLKRD